MRPTISIVVFMQVSFAVMRSNYAFYHVSIAPSAGSRHLLSTSSSATMGETNNNYNTPDVSSSSSWLLDPKTVSSLVFANDRRPVILFDGVCNMCNSAVNLALDWDPKGCLRFSALQSNVGRALLEANGRKADDISSIVLVTEDGAYIKSDAVLKITEELTPVSLLPLKPVAVLSRWMVPKFLRDIIYDNVADNRYQIMGKRNECRLDSNGDFADRFIDDSIAMKR
jgi:predicted DCC family thiol-disulfide oxidoreductase YuxK